jgi:hypothetical protein
LKAEIATYRAEARFLRATYWHLIDMFGGGSLVTEESQAPSFIQNMQQEQNYTSLLMRRQHHLY